MILSFQEIQIFRINYHIKILSKESALLKFVKFTIRL